MGRVRGRLTQCKLKGRKQSRSHRRSCGRPGPCGRANTQRCGAARRRGNPGGRVQGLSQRPQFLLPLGDSKPEICLVPGLMQERHRQGSGSPSKLSHAADTGEMKRLRAVCTPRFPHFNSLQPPMTSALASSHSAWGKTEHQDSNDKSRRCSGEGSLESDGRGSGVGRLFTM